MSRRQKTRHGAHVSAPREDGFTGDDSPEPPGVAARRSAAGRSVPPGPPGALAKLWSFTKLGAGVILVVAASLGVAWGAHRYALTTPRFAIQTIEVQGARKRGEDQIAKQMGVKVGDNIFSVDTVLAERRVLEDPWIREIKITRSLPATLHVEIAEREAAAIASIGDQMYLVTRSGEPFKRLEDGDPFDLPVITGIDPKEIARDRVREIERVATGIQILRHWERIGVSKTHPAQEVHLTPGGDAVLTVGKGGIALHLGAGPWRKKLLMAERVMQRLAGGGRTPGVVFLDNAAHPERVVVRMR